MNIFRFILNSPQSSFDASETKIRSSYFISLILRRNNRNYSGRHRDSKAQGYFAYLLLNFLIKLLSIRSIQVDSL
ncbi:hypothetical protein HY02_08150 [Peptococcaceae bacterium SCADC1_2_3]|jgi:hypothetical protein|nr:hypothetical protein DK28_0209485 [Peptococcaceae bacterium SCADC1_2_3]KFI37314.1 hypothetical protein HY02_08150 [Peptococcaceae bacterium SCADC1_2_3]